METHYYHQAERPLFPLNFSLLRCSLNFLSSHRHTQAAPAAAARRKSATIIIKKIHSFRHFQTFVRDRPAPEKKTQLSRAKEGKVEERKESEKSGSPVLMNSH
jgi:hypothetical protein